MAAESPITITTLTWSSMVKELRERGRGMRESGAFLLGHSQHTDRHVVRFVCYDDLDPRALTDGIITFHEEGYSALWDLCRAQKLKVLADVHTHPTSNVRQSWIDAAHPMLATIGHVGLILPFYGFTRRWSLAGVGVHVFRGAKQWDSWYVPQKGCPVQLSLW